MQLGAQKLAHFSANHSGETTSFTLRKSVSSNHKAPVITVHITT